MKLFNVTSKEYQSYDTFFPCTNAICRVSGFRDPHVCFTTMPLQGEGRWVHEVDLPEHIVAEFGYENKFRSENVKYYAVPLRIVDELPYTKYSFEELMGKKWNRFRVAMREEKDSAWSLLWGSRASAATPSIVEVQESPPRLVVGVTLAEDFDPTKDYIIQERHWETSDSRGRPNERWALNLVAGVMPQWGVFPTAWAA